MTYPPLLLRQLRLWLLALLFCGQSLANDTALINEPVLQPGDIIFISYPGEAGFNVEFEINERGQITLPEIGQIKVTGKTIKTARQLIQVSLNTSYRDVTRLDVTLRERNLMVQVMGYVGSPGMVSVPVNGNIQTAIQLAGGLLPGAQLNEMQVQRGKNTMTFSYKAYLDSGDQSQLPKLHPLDVIFVPASPLIGNVQIDFDAQTLKDGGDAADQKKAIQVFGEVGSPGKYTMEEDFTVIDAIMRAGGVTRYAGVEQIRVITKGNPLTFNLKKYLESGDDELLPLLFPGDTLFVPMKVEEIKIGANMVYVMGEVFKPGAFEGKPGATLLDILANAGGPTRFADSRQIRILRANGEVTPFDLAEYAEGNAGEEPNTIDGVSAKTSPEKTLTIPQVYPGDAIFIPEKTDINEASWLKVPPQRSIHIIGQVYNPGRFEWSDEMSLLDLLAHAEGPTARADISHLKILAKDDSGIVTSSTFNLEQFLNVGGAISSLPVLHAGYTVVIPELPQDPDDNKAQWARQSKEHSIYIMGSIGSPGRYMFNSELGFLDILTAADGPTPDADLRMIKIVHRNGNVARTTLVDLSLYFETGDETLLPQVLPGDTIYVPDRSREWLQKSPQETVRVIGAVKNPGRYSFSDDMSVLDLIAEAGGTNASAYLENIVVVNTSCCIDKASSFDLLAFVKKPDYANLPVIRAGDTLFIPDKSDSNWQIFMDGVTDVFKIVSIFALIGAL